MSIRFGSQTKFDTIATVWQPTTKTTDNGKTIIQANLSTGRKTQAVDKATNKPIYRNSNWRATFVGNAATKFKSLDIKERDSITITAGEVETSYDKTKKVGYTNVTIFDFEKFDKDSIQRTSQTQSQPNNYQNNNYQGNNNFSGFMNVPEDSNLPFGNSGFNV